MLRKFFALALLGPLPAFAGFALEGNPVLSTQQGEMSRHTPYEDRGMASFKQPDAGMQPKQKQFENAELLVDLAYTPLTEMGSGEAILVEGFGDEVPFPDAMAMIIPTGWQLYKKNELPSKDVPEVVSFNGGKRWPDVLRDIGLRKGLQFHVDWYRHTIEMGKGRPVVANNRRIKVIEELRIPRSSGHPFHEHLTTDSTVIRPPIPRASGH